MTEPFIERRAFARTTSLRLVKLREVLDICGLSRSSVYAAIKDDRFPRPVALGGRARAWLRHEVEAWVVDCVRASRNAPTRRSPALLKPSPARTAGAAVKSSWRRCGPHQDQ